MKISLVGFVQNKIYKNPINKEKSAQIAPSKSDFSLAQNILSNYSKAMISFGNSININELEEYIIEHPEKNQKELAKHFHVSPSSISQAIEEFKIPYSKKYSKNPITKEALEEYIKANPDKNQAEIAKHFNTTISNISALIGNYEIEYKNKRKGNIPKEEIRDYIIQHPKTTRKEVAELFGISLSGVTRILHEYDIECEKQVQKRIIPKEELENYIKANPKGNLREIAEHFGVSAQTILNLIKKYDISYTRKSRQGKNDEN